MDEFRNGCTKKRVKIDMLIGIGEPFLPSHYMGYLHLPVIYHVRQMESRPSVLPHYHEIVQTLELQLSKDLIVESCRGLDIISLDSDSILLLVFDFGSYLIQGEPATSAIVRLWFFIRVSPVLLAEARVCHSTLKHVLFVVFVDMQAFALDIGTVFPWVLD